MNGEWPVTQYNPDQRCSTCGSELHAICGDGEQSDSAEERELFRLRREVVQTNHRTSLVTEEDKALLAAAPEMIALLRKISAAYPTGGPCIADVHALLKRLEGV